MTKFQSLGLEQPLLQAITDLGFETPSEVQEKTIPILLAHETDMVSLAQTGTGKTAAFGFPMLQKIDIESRTTQGLILSPTRELCLQITSELKLYGKYLPGLNVVAVYGGASITEQAKQIKKGAQIIVATPGRMKDMIGRRMLDISKIEYCVLDEADEMLNMGFYEDITDILSHTPEDKCTWLFSATMPKEVAAIAQKFMDQPQEVTIGAKNVGADSVSHEYYLVNAKDRYQALKRLADMHPDIFSVVFCRTKRDTQKVAEMLIEDGYNAAALHGDLSQNQRDLVMKSFRTRQIQMLVATDVAARGIDVDDITHVINYQLPDEIETYTHRSGRTGRAGKTGVSMVIISKSEQRKIKAIEKIIQKSFIQKEVPSGMEICEKQLFHLANSIKDTEVNHDIDPYLPKIHEVLEDFSKEELIKKVFSVEFTRFYNYYKKAKDLNVGGGNHPEDREPAKVTEDSTRYFINLGRKDGLQWMDLKDLIREVTELPKDDVFHVDTMDTFSFFNTDSKYVDLVIEAFKGVQFNDRRVEIEISKDRGGRKFGGGGRGKDKGRKKGGFGKKGGFPDDRPKFKGKSRRKEEWPKEKGTGGKRRRKR
ncbi:MAG TPA: DEAD/DEAH box helicase [Flavobacteriaceae bacterium]|nr:DEAD/DEAH box helicase [Flavobacteriaceae bacterium]MCB9212479.1 DEAD/DEAH box helicase [Alteromonas sp.]HPF10542.1 DEAD/DEAH box helicase [Flavobacteriaceae bacterium]HQU20230.1 DEAD/DEAH box helicase [Flavobacteriaceae bacterium]HQU66028.1 DEAD/DEAH box helicase [Flavobacteriaceae bacterium]